MPRLHRDARFGHFSFSHSAAVLSNTVRRGDLLSDDEKIAQWQVSFDWLWLVVVGQRLSFFLSSCVLCCSWDRRAARGNGKEKDERVRRISTRTKTWVGLYDEWMNAWLTDWAKASTRCASIVILTDIQARKHHVSVYSRKSRSIEQFIHCQYPLF